MMSVGNKFGSSFLWDKRDLRIEGFFRNQENELARLRKEKEAEAAKKAAAEQAAKEQPAEDEVHFGGFYLEDPVERVVNGYFIDRGNTELRRFKETGSVIPGDHSHQAEHDAWQAEADGKKIKTGPSEDKVEFGCTKASA